MTASINRKHSIALVLSLSTVVAASTGCIAPAADSVSPRLEVIDRTNSALSAASITSLTGTYGAACDGRAVAGTDAWTLSVSGGPAADELSVRKNDADCVLTITSVVTVAGSFIGAPAIDLSTSNAYKASASAFALSAQPVAFYGNAKISALTFAADFTISLLVSDSPNASDAGNKGATFATQSGTLSASTVPASNYTISYASFGVSKDVNNVVQSVSGYAQLTAGAATGQDYAIYEGALTGASTVPEVETAWAAATTKGLLSALTTLQLPASGFGLPAVDLDTSPKRTVIIRNTDTGVSSYQLILTTFIP
jgi:hypothetical protein